MAKRKKACKNPVTAQKVGRGIKISVTVPTLAAAKKVVKRLGVKMANPSLKQVLAVGVPIGNSTIAKMVDGKLRVSRNGEPWRSPTSTERLAAIHEANHLSR